jgi:hypothetical protein
VALVTIALAQAAWSPWLALGLRLDPTLDTRGVAAVLDRVEEVEGPVLAEDVFSSLLLKHPAVVLQGVIADGRQEAFPIGYYADVYQPLLRPGANWPELIGRTGVAFYYEPFPRRENSPSLAGAFESLGWRLVAWDESGRLFARPDVIARHGLEVLKVDPARLESLQSVGDEQLRAAADEVLQRTEWLEEQGFPSARGRIAHARLALAAGDLEAAAASLDKAAAEGAARFSSYWQTLAAVRMMQGDIEGAAEAEARGR